MGQEHLGLRPTECGLLVPIRGVATGGKSPGRVNALHAIAAAGTLEFRRASTDPGVVVPPASRTLVSEVEPHGPLGLQDAPALSHDPPHGLKPELRMGLAPYLPGVVAPVVAVRP